MSSTITINPYALRGREADAGPALRTLLLAMAAMWAAALVLGGIGFRATYGAWPPGADAWFLLPLFLAPLALPVGLFHALGGWGLGLLAIPLAALFWPAVLGLQFAACWRRRWIYLVPVALLLVPAAWQWVVTAIAMNGI